jgi:hypothetical protein
MFAPSSKSSAVRLGPVSLCYGLESVSRQSDWANVELMAVFLFLFFFFVVLEFGLRAFTLSHSTSPFL